MKSKKIIETYINDIPISTLDLCLTERPKIPSPQMRVERIEVPGRNGSLTKKDAYDDITITCIFSVLLDYHYKGRAEKRNVKHLLSEIKGMLYQAKKLNFEDDDRFYKVKSVDVSNIDNRIEQYGEFDASFECDPFLYYETQEKEIQNGGKIANIGTVESAPIITVNGSGDGTLTVAGSSIAISGQTAPIIIDCEEMTAYSLSQGVAVNQNRKIRGDLPLLPVGESIVSWDGGISAVTIDGRWRDL